jgi:ATP-dependent Clp protease ATP-binding subunit ClpC
MFERYREDARRAIFFARWEAQQSGSAYIEPAHLLLSLTHDADSKANQLFGLAAHAESFRQQLASHASAQSSTSVDLPLSNTGKRVLAYTVEEADKLASRPIGTEHVLLGLLREKNQACRQRSGRRESISTLQEIGSEKIAGYQSLTASQLILTASQLIKRLPSDHCGHSRVSRFCS